jgi:hypothetical protein
VPSPWSDRAPRNYGAACESDQHERCGKGEEGEDLERHGINLASFGAQTDSAVLNRV